MGARVSRANVPRCWCCGSRFVDKASLLNERQGIFVKKYHPTGEYVCPNQCPSKEQHDEFLAERAKDIAEYEAIRLTRRVNAEERG